MIEEHSKASAWFDGLYSEHKDNFDNIPWARQDVNPLLKSYLQEQKVHKGIALVIGCGLGDDARAIEEAGYDVVAIDVSQTALDLAKSRFEKSTITFEKQDIFDMPQKYHHHFDFVFEAFTIQSLPVEFREKMIKAVTNTIKDGGKILLVAHQRERLFPGPPWPLEAHEVEYFKNHGLKEISHSIHKEDSPISNTKFRVLYEK